MDLMSLLSGGTGQTLVNGLSQQLGVKDQNVASAVSMAVPFLLSQMKKNAEDPNEAEGILGALDQHKSKSMDVESILSSPNMADGLGILGHVFGDKQTQVAKSIGNKSGISTGQTMQLLATLAPVLMGFLGNQKEQNNVSSASALPGLFGSLLGSVTGGGNSNSGAMGMISGLLDQNGDGNISDEVMNIGGKLLGSFFKK